MFGVVALSLVIFIFIETSVNSDEALLQRAREIFGVVKFESYPSESQLAARAALGKKLFFDRRLSKDESVSCSSCHSPNHYGADIQAHSLGVERKKSDRNSLSILNLRYQHYFQWRLDRASIEDQAEKAFMHPDGLGNSSEKETLSKIIKAGYESQFQKAFAEDKIKISIKNAAMALALYQKNLTTPAPFDRFLEGDIQALGKEQREGFRNFMNLGCVSCHNGPAIGGRDFQRFGLTKDYWEVTGSKVKDPGRMTITSLETDRNVFKVPSLRNVAKTAPYFHDGSAPDLMTAIQWMAQLQLNKVLSPHEVKTLQSFLESLTGEIPEDFKPGINSK